MSRSLRARLTIGVIAVVAALLVAFASLLYVAARNAAWQQHDDGLVARVRALAASSELDDGVYEISLPPESGPGRQAFIEVWRPDGTVLARSPSLGAKDLPATLAGSAAPAFGDLELPDGRTGRAIGLRFLPRTDVGTQARMLSLVLADGTQDVDTSIASVRTWFLVLALAALAAIAALTAWTVS